MSTKILNTVQTLAKASECFTEVRFSTFRARSAGGVHTAKMDTPGETVFDVSSTGSYANPFVGNIVFHARVGVNLQLNWLHRRPQSLIIHSRVNVVCIVFRVVDMVSLAYSSLKSFLGDFEFSRGVPKCHKGEDPYQYPNGTRLNALERTDIQCLRVIYIGQY